MEYNVSKENIVAVAGQGTSVTDGLTQAKIV